jgi:hypothetical protein
VIVPVDAAVKLTALAAENHLGKAVITGIDAIDSIKRILD